MPQTITPQQAREAEAACVFTNLDTVLSAATQLFDRALAPAGVNIEQLGYLVCLRGIATHSVRSLAERKCKDTRAVRDALLVLQSVGWVDVPASDDDPVQITAGGIAKLNEGAALWSQSQSAVVESIGGDDAWKATLTQLTELFASMKTLR